MILENAIHIEVILEELAWFEQILDTRLKLYFEHECSYASIDEIPPPDHSGKAGYYARFVSHYKTTVAERLVLMLTLTPHIRPQLLDVFCIKNATYDKGFTEFGGIKGTTHGGFLPTAETALFLLAGNDLYARWEATDLFKQRHYFIQHNILRLEDAGNNEPYLSGAITLMPDFVHYFLSGQNHSPHFSKDFPAKLITTEMNWSDLVLPADTRTQIEEIKTWIQHHHTLLYDWGFHKKLKPGYKSLFYGPPGTGKTSTLVEYIQREVARGARVLACAPSNVAVDNLLTRLVATPGQGAASSAPSPLRAVRLGHPARIDATTLRYSLDAQVAAAEGSSIVADVRNELATAIRTTARTRDRAARRASRADERRLRKEVREREERVVTDILADAQVVAATTTGAASRVLLKAMDRMRARAQPGAPVSSSSSSSSSSFHGFDVVVIDEIQMLGDAQRGGSWTAAVLGVQAKEIHLCGDETTVQLLQSLLEPMGDKVTVHNYDRLTPLTVANESLEGDYSNIQPGDCVVTFSRSNIFAV
ncbi:MAG: hypothetical protein EOO38_09955, partial [Cytophagaceae bacterium]